MSVETSRYHCPQCGYNIGDLDEGIVLFGEAEYMIFKCKDCGNLQSEKLTQKNEEFLKKFSCRCCESKNLEIWDHRCPHCGGELQQEILHLSD